MGKRAIPVVLTESEQEDLLDQFNERYVTSHRNKVMFQLMLNTGLRVSEIVSLRWEDVNLTSAGKLMVREGARELKIGPSGSMRISWSHWVSGRKGRWKKLVNYPGGSFPL